MSRTLFIMDRRKDLTFCHKGLAFAFTPHILNNAGEGGRERGQNLNMFSED